MYEIKNIKDYTNIEIESFLKKIYLKKQIRINKYKSKSAKKRSIIGEIILSNLLKKYYNINYCEINFEINEYGKPFIKDHHIYFNISHSFDYVITAISNYPIGIDIEKIRNVKSNIINYIATNNEKKYIFSSLCSQDEKIFEIYTLKEAYFKMKGTNLENLLDIEFKIENNKIVCSDNSVSASLIKNLEGYIVAYCEKKYFN